MKSVWKTEIDWLLPGATLHQVRDLADPVVATGMPDRQLVATVTDGDRLRAQIADPRAKTMRPTLSARLLPDDRGLLVQGQVTRIDTINLTIWLAIWCAIALTVVASARNGVALVGGLAFVAVFGAFTPKVRTDNSRRQRLGEDQLLAALLSRFAVDD